MPRPPYSVAFLRPDGATQSGMGHLFRCLHLAAALREHFDVTVLIDEAPASFLAVLDSHGVGWRRQATEDKSIARQIVVFDGYRFNAADFTKAREKGNLVVVIDDLASGYFDCDLVISHGPQNRRQDYKAANDCRFLLGCEYALIDPCFYSQAYVFRPAARRLFVNFGGSDPLDLTSFAAEALAGNDLELDLVVGAGYRHIDRLQRFVTPHVRVYRDLRQTEVATTMAKCDAAIASGGTTSLELGAVGVPSLLFAFADNHVRPCIAFEQQKLAVFGGMISDQKRDSFQRAVETFRAAEATRRAIHIETRRLFRESGAPRVASEIAALAASRRIGTRSVEAMPHVTLEPFAPVHLANTRRWITDRRVTEPFLYSGKVTESSHRDWFARVQADRSQFLFAVRDSAGTHVGNVGFRKSGSGNAIGRNMDLPGARVPRTGAGQCGNSRGSVGWIQSAAIAAHLSSRQPEQCGRTPNIRKSRVSFERSRSASDRIQRSSDSGRSHGNRRNKCWSTRRNDATDVSPMARIFRIDGCR